MLLQKLTNRHFCTSVELWFWTSVPLHFVFSCWNERQFEEFAWSNSNQINNLPKIRGMELKTTGQQLQGEWGDRKVYQDASNFTWWFWIYCICMHMQCLQRNSTHKTLSYSCTAITTYEVLRTQVQLFNLCTFTKWCCNCRCSIITHGIFSAQANSRLLTPFFS